MGEKLHVKSSLYAYVVHMSFSMFMKKMALNWALKDKNLDLQTLG